MRRVFLIIIVLVLCVANRQAHADVVYLKDGTIVEGKFISDTTTGMYFEVEKDGQTETVKFTYDEIESVDFMTTSIEMKKERAIKEAQEKKKTLERDSQKEEPADDAEVQVEEINMEDVIERAQQIAEELGLVEKTER